MKRGAGKPVPFSLFFLWDKMADDITILDFEDAEQTIMLDDVGGIKVQIIKIATGGNGVATEVSAGNPFPVTAASLPLPSGASTSALQTTGNTALTAIQTAVEALDNAISGSEMQVDIVGALPTGTNTIGSIKLTDGTLTASIRDTGSSDSLNVSIVDASGNQITSFGGSVTQYTEGDTDASITGTAVMMEVAANTLQPIQGTVADGLLVNLGSNNDVTIASLPLPSGASTSANQSTIIGHLDGVEALLTTIDADTSALFGTVSGSELQVDIVTSALPTGAATSANQSTIIGHVDGIEALLATIDADTSGIITAVELLDDTVKVLGTDTYTEATSKGLIIGGVRRDADTTLVNTTNEFAPFQLDANGRLKVEAFSGEALPVTMASTTITGTVAVTQSGTWDEVGIHDSGNSITVDNGGTFATQVDGAALTALQLLDDAVATTASAITTKGFAAAGTDGTNARILKTDSSGELQIDVLTLPAIPTGTNIIGSVKITDGTDVVDVLDLTSSNPLVVAIVDANGDQITSFGGSGGTSATDDAAFTAGSGTGTPAMGFFSTDTVNANDVGVLAMDASRRLLVSIEADNVGIGGGIQYTEGDTDASITGTVMMMEVAADTLQPVQGTVANGLLVNVSTSALPTGAATSAKQDTIIGHVDGIEALLATIDADTSALFGTVAGTELQVDIVTSALPSGASTSANQTTIIGHLDGVEGLLTTIDADTGSIMTAVELIDDTVVVLGTDTYTEATSKGLVIGGVRRDADTTLVGTTNEFAPFQLDANGRLKVEAFSGETLPVSLTSTTITGTVAVTQSGTWDEVGINDSGNSITVDNAQLSVVGSGTEATAMRVTIATDSTGVLSIDDNGGSITVDGTVTANLAAGTNNIGDVDILTIAAGDNNIGNVDIVSLPASTNTLEVVGDAAHDAAIAGNPVRIGGRALTSDITAVAAGDTCDLITTLLGKLVTIPYANPANTWSYAAASGGITNTTGVTVKAAAGAGIRNYITSVDVENGHATVSTDVRILDGASGTVLWRGFAQAAGGGVAIEFNPPLRGTANTLVEVANGTTGSATYFNVRGFVAAE